MSQSIDLTAALAAIHEVAKGEGEFVADAKSAQFDRLAKKGASTLARALALMQSRKLEDVESAKALLIRAKRSEMVAALSIHQGRTWDKQAEGEQAFTELLASFTPIVFDLVAEKGAPLLFEISALMASAAIEDVERAQVLLAQANNTYMVAALNVRDGRTWQQIKEGAEVLRAMRASFPVLIFAADGRRGERHIEEINTLLKGGTVEGFAQALDMVDAKRERIDEVRETRRRVITALTIREGKDASGKDVGLVALGKM